MFNQLQKHLAATAKALAPLELVEHYHRLAGQLHENLLAPGSTDALTVTLVSVDFGRCRHRALDSISRADSVQPKNRVVHRFLCPSRVYYLISFGFGFAPMIGEMSIPTYLRGGRSTTRKSKTSAFYLMAARKNVIT